MHVRSRGWIINPEDLTRRLIDRLAASGINELGIHPGGGKAAPELLLKTLAFHEEKRTRELYDYAGERGVTVEYDAHVLSYLLPRSEFSVRPEWFRMDESGARVNDANMCASNEDALDYVSKRARELALTLKTPSHRYAYWTDDIVGKTCRCPRCREKTAAQQTLTITNAIARGLKSADPQAITGFLAYLDALEVPEGIRPEKGVYLEYAPIGRDSARAINDAQSPENVHQTAKLAALIAYFSTKNARVVEYWADNSRFSNWTRPPKYMSLNAQVMRADVKYYLECGFEDMTSFACFLGEDYEALYGPAPVEEYGEILSGEY